MNRVVIIGSGGSGKSTLARQMGELTGLPVVHLDREHWGPGWVEPPKEAWQARVAELAAAERWIIDGNYGGTMESRIARADTVLFLDLPRRACLWSVIKRRVVYHNRPRPDMTEGCDERLDWHFMKWIWDYPRDRRPGILAMLRAAKAEGKDIHRLRSRRAIERYVAALGNPAADAPRANA